MKMARRLDLIARDLAKLSPADQQPLTSFDYGIRSLAEDQRAAVRRILRDMATEPGVVRIAGFGVSQALVSQI